MRAVNLFKPTTLDLRRVTPVLLLVTCLGACEPSARHDASIAVVDAAAPASIAPPARPAVSPANAALAVAIASEQASRAAREQTLRVQRQLVEQQRAARDAAVQSGNGNERCLSGQKMRRVANGWVQAGSC